MINLYSEEQVKDLLREQRRLCALKVKQLNTDFPDDLNCLIAERPELPEPYKIDASVEDLSEQNPEMFE